MDKEYKGCVSWENQVGKNNSEVVQKMVWSTQLQQVNK